MFKQIKLLLFLKKKRKRKAVMYVGLLRAFQKMGEKSIYLGKRFMQLMCLFVTEKSHSIVQTLLTVILDPPNAFVSAIRSY